MGRKRARHQRGRRGQSKQRKPHALVTGVLRVLKPGMAELHTAEGTFDVARGGIREAMSGDEVQATLSSSHDGRRLARVQSVLVRNTTTFAGVYRRLEPLGAVVPLDTRVKRDFFVVPEDKSPERLAVAEGDLVRARIVEYPTRHSAGIVTIDARIGSSDDVDMNIESVIASYDLATEFPKEALDQAEGMREDVAEALAQEPLRRDVRDHCVFTTDPTDARDFDDAVGARRLDDGYEVEVHIADVTHFVGWDTPIDREARRRTCSVYLVDRVLPMLPERLCNDVCSLKPGVDRLCMSVFMRLDRRGNVVSADPAPTAIRSVARLDYDTVDRLLEGTATPDDLPCCDAADRPRVAESIRVLDEVAALRRARREERGAIDFDTAEAKVTLDEKGVPTGVRVRRKTRATSLVEEAMLIANESVAKFLSDAEAPAAYRVHEPPAAEDLRATLPVLRELQLVDAPLAARVAEGDPHAIQDVLRAARGTSGEFLANSVLLRAQRRAVYLPKNEGHYALGAPAYCHFTSPIRRYPDDIVHRSLRALLEGRRTSREQMRVLHVLPQLCRTCSERERLADGAERDTQNVKMAELYKGHVGESFSGVVVGVERYGLFVMLDDTCAEGLVPVRALGDEWFDFDEKRMCLTGGESGRAWRPGQRVAVTVTDARPERGQIDFGLARGRDASK